MASIPFELKGKTVYVAGHRGMVGSALVRRLARENVELLTATRSEVDLRDQAAVNQWFAARRPQVVFLAAAKVGGIVANNTLRAEFLYDNLAIATNVIHAAHVNGAEKLMFLGSPASIRSWRRSRCARIRMLTGPLEPTNEPYAIAKIAGIKMVEAYRSQYGADFINVMPTNLYGKRRQLSSRIQPRRRRPDPPLPRSKGFRRRERRGLGHRHAAARVSLCRRSRGRLHPFDEDLFRRRTGQYRHRRGHHHRRIRPRGGGDRRLYRRDQFRRFAAGRHPAQTARRLRLAKLGWRASTSLEDGIRLAYQAYLSETK